MANDTQIPDSLRFAKVDQVTTRNTSMRGRRVVGAANAQDPQDYATLDDVTSRIAAIKNNTGARISLGQLPTSIRFNPIGDAMQFGAFGDNIHDDTKVLQSVLNTTGGFLYLRPGKIFRITSTLVCPAGGTAMLYGGGTILAAGTASVIQFNNTNQIMIMNVNFNCGNGIGVNLTNYVYALIDNCLFFGSGTGVAIQSSTSGSVRISDTIFSSFTTAVSLLAGTGGVDNCQFVTTTNTVTTAGGATFNMRGSNDTDNYDPPITRCLAYQTNNQNMTNNVAAPLFFDVNAWNFSPTGGLIHPPGGSVFTIPVTGLWQVEGAVAFPASNLYAASSACYIQIEKNGSVFSFPHNMFGSCPSMSNFGVEPLAQVHGPIQLLKNDTITFIAFQNFGGTFVTVTLQTWGSVTLLSRP